MLLMQTARGVRQGTGTRRGLAEESGGGEEIQEETILVQVGEICTGMLVKSLVVKPTRGHSIWSCGVRVGTPGL